MVSRVHAVAPAGVAFTKPPVRRPTCRTGADRRVRVPREPLMPIARGRHPHAYKRCTRSLIRRFVIRPSFAPPPQAWAPAPCVGDGRSSHAPRRGQEFPLRDATPRRAKFRMAMAIMSAGRRFRAQPPPGASGGLGYNTLIQAGQSTIAKTMQ